jgi:lipopolysaccharide/colanic/teichoic acid biosynthesis glycosyltransferase
MSAWNERVKRAFDLCGSLAGLIITAPILAVVAVLIKLTSRGPVLYRQVRVGKMGHLFTLFKFRTMNTDNNPAVHKKYVQSLICGKAPAADGVYKIVNDPRITRIGSFLRKTSLDELPQLFNVLMGDMSLVGPRPPIPYEVEVYQPWHHTRLFVKPGITGLWQVSGRNRTSFSEMVMLDIHYTASFSIWNDLKILVKTPLVMVTGR